MRVGHAVGRAFAAPTHKYHARAVVRDGVRFDSTAEADRYAALRWLEKAGQIRDLERQPVFALVVNGQKVGNYRGDFAYTVVATSERITEDVKGVRTPVYRLKKKLVAALHGVAIAEIHTRDVHVKAVPSTTQKAMTRRGRR